MKQPLIAQFEAKHMKSDIPDFRPGDTIRVYVKITEKSRDEERSRVQPFEGVVIKRSGGALNETVTVRRVTYSVGVERTFPLHAPVVDRIEVLRRGRVRRARLYYLRGRSGRASRITELREGASKPPDPQTDTDEAAAEVEPEAPDQDQATATEPQDATEPAGVAEEQAEATKDE